MTSYGTNSAAQILAYGAADSTQDTRTAACRDLATVDINTHLGLANDLVTVPANITQCANALAAGYLLQSPGDKEDNAWLKKGRDLLENLNLTDIDRPENYNVVVARF